MKYAFLAATIGMLAAGQILFKLSAEGTTFSRWDFLFKPTFLIALGIYAAATLCWVHILKIWPITIAYPATAISIALVVFAGIFIFGERPSVTQILGIATILAGVTLLAAG